MSGKRQPGGDFRNAYALVEHWCPGPGRPPLEYWWNEWRYCARCNTMTRPEPTLRLHSEGGKERSEP